MNAELDNKAICPNCHGKGMGILYATKGIPVHSTQTVVLVVLVLPLVLHG